MYYLILIFIVMLAAFLIMVSVQLFRIEKAMTELSNLVEEETVTRIA